MNPAPLDGPPGDLSAAGLDQADQRTPRSKHDQPADLALSGARYASFLVRVLREGSNSARISGQITHVATRRTRHFSTAQALVSFIETHLGAKLDAPSAAP